MLGLVILVELAVSQTLAGQLLEFTAVTSSAIDKADTTALVYITIRGSDGVTPATLLPVSVTEELGVGPRDTLAMDLAVSIGVIESVTLSVTDGDMWHLGYVVVKDAGTGATFVSPCDRWTGTALTLVFTPVACPMAGDKHKDPASCQRYFQGLCGPVESAQHLRCESNLYNVYNPATQTCDYPVNVGTCLSPGALKFLSHSDAEANCYSFTRVNTGTYDVMESIEADDIHACFKECTRIGEKACTMVKYDSAAKKCHRVTDVTQLSPIDCAVDECHMRNL